MATQRLKRFPAVVVLLLWACPGLGLSDSPVFSVPISLPDLVRASHRIFVGVVEKVATWPPEGLLGEARLVREIHFRVEKVLKGPIDPTQPLVIRQPLRYGFQLDPGEKVLWFVAPEYTLNVAYPLGLDSGDFRIRNGADGEPEALSRNGNRALWSEEADLWSTGANCDRDRFLALMQENPDLSRSRMLDFLALADSPYFPRPLPVGFLELAIRACQLPQMPPAE